LQKSFKGEANAKLRTEKQNKSGFFCVSILLQVKNAYSFQKGAKKWLKSKHPNKSNEKP